MNARVGQRSAWWILSACGACGAAAMFAVHWAVDTLADAALYRVATLGAFGVAIAIGWAQRALLAPERSAWLLAGALAAFGAGASTALIALDAQAPPGRTADASARPLALRALSATGTALEPICSNGLPSALRQRVRERVLVAGFGSGIDFACALQHGARVIDIAEPDATTRASALASGSGTASALAASAHARLSWHAVSARALATAAHDARYDLVLLPATRIVHTWPAGLLPIPEDSLRTDRGLRALLSTLAPQGELFAVEVGEPAALRFVNTALLALRDAGIARPAHHVVVHQSGESYGIRVRVAPFDLDEMLELHRRAHAQASEDPAPQLDALLDGAERFPDLRYVPGSTFQNRVGELLAGGDAQRVDLVRRYAFDIAPLRDQRPLPAEWTRRDRPQTWSSHSSLLVLPRYTLLALVFAFVLAIGAWAWPERAGAQRVRSSKRTWFALAALGFAHGLVFAWSRHELTLWLARPALAYALTLLALLGGAGAGLGWGRRKAKLRRPPDWRAHAIALASFISVTLLFDRVLTYASPAGIAWLLALAGAVLGALGFALALPLAATIDAAAQHDPPQSASFLLAHALAIAVVLPLSATLVLFAGYSAVALMAVSALTLAPLIAPRHPA